MPNDKDTEIRSRYESYTVEELKEAYQTIFLYSSEYSDADLAEMDEIIAILKKKNPVPRKYDTAESWELFQKTYSEELSRLGIHDAEEVIQENPPADAEEVPPISEVKTTRRMRCRKLLRVAVLAAVIMVFLAAVAVTASSLGCNLFGWVPKWNSDVLGFGEDESPEPNELHDTYKIPAALKELGIEELLYPTWLPEGFKIDVSVIETDPVFMHEGYSDGDRYLSITIEPSDNSETGVFEKDDLIPYKYIVNKHIHYIFSDVDQLSATWNTGGYGVLLVGNVSLEEMKKMIDSVYEVKK